MLRVKLLPWSLAKPRWKIRQNHKKVKVIVLFCCEIPALRKDLRVCFSVYLCRCQRSEVMWITRESQ